MSVTTDKDRLTIRLTPKEGGGIQVKALAIMLANTVKILQGVERKLTGKRVSEVVWIIVDAVLTPDTLSISVQGVPKGAKVTLTEEAKL